MDYVTCYSGYYPTFLEGGGEGWGLGLFALRLSKEAGPKRVFESFHDGVVVGKKDFVLVEGFLLNGGTPGL